VIRRHPDIKLLRKSADIKALSKVQANLLDQLWKTLKPGGHLLYATCSILPDENTEAIEAFLSRQNDANELALDIKADAETARGKQWLPQKGGHDGFFYALLQKSQ
jgi:16S rRNA (cytosine967-C5)-methyltransferase